MVNKSGDYHMTYSHFMHNTGGFSLIDVLPIETCKILYKRTPSPIPLLCITQFRKLSVVMQLSAFNSWFTFPCRVLHMQSLYVENAMVEICRIRSR